MPKSRKYWQDRFTFLQEQMLENGEDYCRSVEKQYRLAMKEIEKDINTWYARLAHNNEISMAEAKQLLSARELKEFRWDVNEYIRMGEANAIDQKWMKQLENASARVHISRLEALKMQVQQHIEVLYGNQVDGLDKLARNIYSEGYYHTAFEIQRGFNVGWDLQSLDSKQLDRVISKPWAADGSNFSSRIWGNKTKLVNNLHTQLTQTIIRGDSPAKAIAEIAKQMNVSKDAAGRLVMTESAFFSAAAQGDSFNDLSVERYEIIATLDSKTSEICQDMDGKTFETKDFEPGVTANPFHPWCRTTTAPYFDDNYGERIARGADGKTYYIPSNITYKEWMETFVVEPNLSKEMYDLKTNLRDFEVKTYSNIWKEDVTTLDYLKKKHSIQGKRDYFQQKIGETSGSEQEKFQTLLDELTDFETQGKLYYGMKERMDEIRVTLTQMNNKSIIKDNPYTQERKDAAYWFKKQSEADAVLRPRTGDLWQSYSPAERKAAYEYTGGSGKFNRPLRGYDGSWSKFKGPGNVPLDNEGGGSAITHLTKALDRSTYDIDIWLQRGVEGSTGLTSFLGISESQLKNSSLEELRQLLIDKVVKDEAFVSTAACKGSGFGGHIFNIYAPKGTKMIYAEPFSAFGHGSKLSWDGIEKQSYFGYEFEVILQRGYNFRITKVDKSGGTYYFDLDVILPE